MPRNTVALPHSWSLKHWPADVWPGNSSQGTYVVRSHRDALLRAGALSRVGRELIVLGDKYARWLELNASRVPGYECPANRDEQPQAAG